MCLRTFRLAVLAGILGLAVAGCRSREESLRKELAESGYELTPEAWFRAAESDDVQALARMVKGGMSVHTVNAAGDTALHAAAVSGMKRSAGFLLDRGVPVDVAGSTGYTPLMAAVAHGNPEMVRYLLKQGADAQRKDSSGCRPLMIAVRERRPQMIRELATRNREDLNDALLVASLLGDAETIDELTSYGASLYTRMEDGRTPLMLAAENGHTDAVKMLVELGANRFPVDGEGLDAAGLAARSGHTELAAWLASAPVAEDYDLEEPMAAGLALERSLERSGTVQVRGGVVRRKQPVSFRGATEEPEEAAEAPRPGRKPSAASIQGAVFSAVSRPESSEPAGPERIPSEVVEVSPPGISLVMRGYRQKELPVKVQSVSGTTAILAIPGRKPEPYQAGASLPGSSLVVVRVEKRMRSSKESEGVPVDVSVVELRDSLSGTSREITTGIPPGASDPVALVEDGVSGQRYIATAGQQFTSAEGTEFRVTDVRPDQLVVENSATGEVWTVPLRGPRG